MSFTENETLVLNADVVVLGGGPAATWAAWSAASSGAKVVLADKGYCGTSGATASAGTGVWFVAPDPEKRAEAKASREALGGFLAEGDWQDRVLDQTYTNMHRLSEWGYPFSQDGGGQPQRGGLIGPHYMKLMRSVVKKAGVTILDHSPALELLVDEHGVGGVAGYQRQENRPYQVRAGAVVIATGGVAFLSNAVGTNVLTGDGALLAAEAGGVLSGMEFSNAYALSPLHSSSTRGAHYRYATFYHEDGSVVQGANMHARSPIAKALLKGQVYARFDQAPESIQQHLRVSQVDFHTVFDRLGINPFTDKFPITLRLEGTMRGTGGIQLTDFDCSTAVSGLYAAGDAATRELICGGFTGGGSHNSAWAMSSGTWAGAGAAQYAASLGDKAVSRNLKGAGRAALRPTSTHKVEADDVIKRVQKEVFPFDKNYFRSEPVLKDSLEKLDDLWLHVQGEPNLKTRDIIKHRESVSLVANARWAYRSALHRTESRGMHKRIDRPEKDPSQQRRLLSGGLDEVWTEFDRNDPLPESFSTPVKEAIAV